MPPLDVLVGVGAGTVTGPVETGLPEDGATAPVEPVVSSEGTVLSEPLVPVAAASAAGAGAKAIATETITMSLIRTGAI